MEQKINIAEILKDAPKGAKLYSPLYGDVEFGELLGNTIRVVDIRGYGQHFDEFGRPTNNQLATECLLFPSKGNRDWSTFSVQSKHKHFDPFQKVLVKGTTDGYYWWAALYSHYDAVRKLHMIAGGGAFSDEYILPYEGNEDLLGKPIESSTL